MFLGNWLSMKILKVAAQSAIVAAHLVPGVMQYAVAQNTLPPVTVTGSSSGGSSGGASVGPGFYNGGGSSSGANGPAPEAEAYASTPAPPPRTQAQKDAAKKDCNDRAAQQAALLDDSWKGELARCAAAVSNYPGYAYDEFMSVFGYGCIQRANASRDSKRFDINVSQQQCLAAADKP